MFVKCSYALQLLYSPLPSISTSYSSICPYTFPSLTPSTTPSFPLSQGMVHALAAIHKQHGILGLWRGSSAAVPRVSVGSAAQLYSFAASKELVVDLQVRTGC